MKTAHCAKVISQTVIVTNPIHPLYGQSVAVQSIRNQGNLTTVMLKHPQGGLLSLSATETDLEINIPSPTLLGQTPLFAIKQLLRLSELVASQNRPDQQESKKVKKINSDDENHKKTEHSPNSFSTNATNI